jgi:hypothetical protein
MATQTAPSLWSRLRRWLSRKPAGPVQVANITPKRARPRGTRFNVELLGDIRARAGKWHDPNRSGAPEDWQALEGDLSRTVEDFIARTRAGEE